MKAVSIVAATFYGNRGAEGMLSTTMAEIRAWYTEPIRFNVFSYYPERDATLVNDPGVVVYSSTPAYLVMNLLPSAILYRLLNFIGLQRMAAFLPKSICALAQSNALICLAGVSFVEGRTKFLPFNIATLLPAMILGIPVIKFAQAMGPFNDGLNRWLARTILGRCTRLFTRGERTHSHIQSLLGGKGNYERADDVAFLFKPEYCLSTPSDQLNIDLKQLMDLANPGQVVVGVCPSIVVAKRAAAAGWDYAQSIAKLMDELIARGYVVALYPNATRGEDMDKTHNNDLPLLNDIENKLAAPSAKHYVKFTGSLNAAQIHRVINACDVHVLSRFHAMVAALSSGIPVLVIGWSHKYLEVMDRFEQADMVIDYKAGAHEAVLARLGQLLDERTQRQHIIQRALSAVQQLSRRQVVFTVQHLMEKP